MSIDLKKRGFAETVLGYDIDPLHAGVAEKIGIVDRAVDLETLAAKADLIVVAVPVDAAVEMLPALLDKIEKQVVTDVCSTKSSIMNAVRDHPRRSRFVSGHPMAGTENSGPWAALSGLFDGRVAIICDPRGSDPDAVAAVEALYRALFMRTIRMESRTHDEHAAYVSHISHISSYALALTVLDKERDEQTIFNLASGGFSSTARLAMSSAAMWTPIFLHNSENILAVLDVYIEKIMQFKRCIEAKQGKAIGRMIKEANSIRRILGSASPGTVNPAPLPTTENNGS